MEYPATAAVVLSTAACLEMICRYVDVRLAFHENQIEFPMHTSTVFITHINQHFPIYHPPQPPHQSLLHPHQPTLLMHSTLLNTFAGFVRAWAAIIMCYYHTFIRMKYNIWSPYDLYSVYIYKYIFICVTIPTTSICSSTVINFYYTYRKLYVWQKVSQPAFIMYIIHVYTIQCYTFELRI